MVAYYNEFDPYAAEWLRNLIAMGEIAPGIVDERSIEDVLPDDLRDFTQCHFFAGIGVWSLALRRAGWPDDLPIWTGSCPCQPFSASGKQSGFADERHLWPHWNWLIGERRPAVVVGEQVASKAAELWFDLVQADLEAMDYAFGCVPFPSAGVGAPHIRDRAYWVGHTNKSGSQGFTGNGGATGRQGPDRPVTEAGVFGGVGYSAQQSRERFPGGFSGAEAQKHGARLTINGGLPVGLKHASQRMVAAGSAGPTNGFWADTDWLFCRDGKWRPVEPGTFPLAHGAPARVGRLRAYGNAINAEQATVFIETVMDHFAHNYN